MDAAYAEMVGKKHMGAHHIADSELRKPVKIKLSRGWIDLHRA